MASAWGNNTTSTAAINSYNEPLKHPPLYNFDNPWSLHVHGREINVDENKNENVSYPPWTYAEAISNATDSDANVDVSKVAASIKGNNTTMLSSSSSSSSASNAIINRDDNSASVLKQHKQQHKQSQPMKKAKVFIGGLSPTTSRNTLLTHCQRWGRIIDVVIMEGRGFGFVTFADEGMAVRFLAEAEHVLDGKQVDPKRAVPKGGTGSGGSGGEAAGGLAGATECRDSNGSLARSTSVASYSVPGSRVTEAERKLFVGGIGGVSDSEVFAHFSKFGELTDCAVLRDANGRDRGFGFVTFSDTAVLDVVLSVSHQLGHRTADVKRAVPKNNNYNISSTPSSNSSSNANSSRSTGRGNCGQSAMLAGDWLCPNPTCLNKNFARRMVCNRCTTVRPDNGIDSTAVGINSNSSNSNENGNGNKNLNINVNWNQNISKGHGPPTVATISSSTETEAAVPPAMQANGSGISTQLGSQESISSTENDHGVTVRLGDWLCESCGNFNFRFRRECRRCKAPQDDVSTGHAVSSQSLIQSNQNQSPQPSTSIHPQLNMMQQNFYPSFLYNMNQNGSEHIEQASQHPPPHTAHQQHSHMIMDLHQQHQHQHQQHHDANQHHSVMQMSSSLPWMNGCDYVNQAGYPYIEYAHTPKQTLSGQSFTTNGQQNIMPHTQQQQHMQQPSYMESCNNLQEQAVIDSRSTVSSVIQFQSPAVVSTSPTVPTMGPATTSSCPASNNNCAPSVSPTVGRKHSKSTSSVWSFAQAPGGWPVSFGLLSNSVPNCPSHSYGSLGITEEASAVKSDPWGAKNDYNVIDSIEKLSISSGIPDLTVTAPRRNKMRSTSTPADIPFSGSWSLPAGTLPTVPGDGASSVVVDDGNASFNTVEPIEYEDTDSPFYSRSF